MEIKYSKSAQTALFRSNKRLLIRSKIEEFAASPDLMAPNVTKLKGSDHYRLRVQDWRVIFEIQNDRMLISEIGPRGSIYRGQ